MMCQRSDELMTILLIVVYNHRLQESLIYEPITPPSFLVTITVAERGRAVPPSGQLLVKLVGVERSPGCWIFTNMVFISGVPVTPVTSASIGPTKKRLSCLVTGSAANIWLLPNGPLPCWAPLMSV